MLVRILKSFSSVHGAYARGKDRDIPDARVDEYIRLKWAEPVNPAKVPAAGAMPAAAPQALTPPPAKPAKPAKTPAAPKAKG